MARYWTAGFRRAYRQLGEMEGASWPNQDAPSTLRLGQAIGLQAQLGGPTIGLFLLLHRLRLPRGSLVS
jgi:hypothetical protein